MLKKKTGTEGETAGNKRLKIAFIGTRGVPGRYGGFETCAEELGRRMAAKGHDVTVYCRDRYYTEKPDAVMGMRTVYLPSFNRKSLETLSHTFLSVCHALFQGYDVHMVFNAANSIVLPILRLFGKRVCINPDGLEWKRAKWGKMGKAYYRFSEKLACLVADRLITDSPGIETYYEKNHNTESAMVAYGAYIQKSSNPGLLEKFGLVPGEYFLQITRFEPENNPLLTIKAYNKLNTDKKLVLVGGCPYENDYIREIRDNVTDGVILPGFIYDKDLLRELWCNSFVYIHGNEVGGTNPALLQSMASGCCVIARNVVFNRQVLAENGLYFDKNPDSLASAMEWTLQNENRLERMRSGAVARIENSYDWDVIADGYETVFENISSGVYSRKF